MRAAWAATLLVLVTVGGCTDDPVDPRPTPTRPTTSATTDGPTDGGTPEAAAEAFFRAFEDGDCAAARAVVLAGSDLDCTIVGESAGDLREEGVDLGEATYTAGDVVDDSATVEVDFGRGEPEPVDLQRVDGAWLVVLDTGA